MWLWATIYGLAIGLNAYFSLFGPWPEAIWNMAAVAWLVVLYADYWLPKKVAALW